MTRHITFLAVLWSMLLLAPATALAETADVEAAARGVVRVIIIGRDGEELFPVSHGTGFAVGGERIVTNAHVVEEAMADESLAIGVVPAEGKEAVYARLIAVSPRNDLALLQLTEPLRLPPLTIAGNPAQSGAVTALGYPMNVDLAQGLGTRDIFRAQPPVMATGFLSGRRPSREFDTVLHTAPIAGGNSGGPLLDDCGRVLGVNSFGTEGAASEAEFFFAVSTRELLPFLRANGVTPRINGLPCRSIADLDAEERARQEQQTRAEAQRVAREEAQLAQQTEEARRTITLDVLDERLNGMALALLLLLAALGAGGVAAWAHVQGAEPVEEDDQEALRNRRLRQIAGSAAVVALLGALLAWFLRPSLAEIDERIEETLHTTGEEDSPTGTIAPPQLAAGEARQFTCRLDPERSRITGAPESELEVSWTDNGCVNARTQYGLSGGEWTRVFVPASEAAVSINRFDPEGGEFVVERYLLDLDAIGAARTARAAYQAPACGGGEQAAQQLGNSQSAITSALPASPNERLVYRCTARGVAAGEGAP